MLLTGTGGVQCGLSRAEVRLGWAPRRWSARLESCGFGVVSFSRVVPGCCVGLRMCVGSRRKSCEQPRVQPNLAWQQHSLLDCCCSWKHFGSLCVFWNQLFAFGLCFSTGPLLLRDWMDGCCPRQTFDGPTPVGTSKSIAVGARGNGSVVSHEFMRTKWLSPAALSTYSTKGCFTTNRGIMNKMKGSIFIQRTVAARKDSMTPRMHCHPPQIPNPGCKGDT